MSDLGLHCLPVISIWGPGNEVFRLKLVESEVHVILYKLSNYDNLRNVLFKEFGVVM